MRILSRENDFICGTTYKMIKVFSRGACLGDYLFDRATLYRINFEAMRGNYFISIVRNSNLGLCFFPFECCVSVDQMSRHLVNF